MTFKVGDRVVRKPGFSNAGRYSTVLRAADDLVGGRATITVRFDDNPNSKWSGYAERFELIGDIEPFEVDE